MHNIVIFMSMQDTHGRHLEMPLRGENIKITVKASGAECAHGIFFADRTRRSASK